MAKGLNEIYEQIVSKILSGGRRTSGENLRSVLYDIKDSYLNVKDGNSELEKPIAFKTILTFNDPKQIPHIKYVDDTVTQAIQSIDLSDYVDKSTNETISGEKEFTGGVKLSSDIYNNEGGSNSHFRSYEPNALNGPPKNNLVTKSSDGTMHSGLYQSDASTIIHVKNETSGEYGYLSISSSGLISFISSPGGGLSVNTRGTGDAIVIKSDNVLSPATYQLPPSGGMFALQSYVDNLTTNVRRLIGNLDCSVNPNYPAGQAGDTYTITVAGRVGGASGKIVNIGDELVCKQNSSSGDEATVGNNWYVLESNRDQATEAISGVAKVATQAAIEDEATTNDADIVTPKKFWQGWNRIKNIASTFAQQITFTLSPIFSSLSVNQEVETDSSKRLVSSPIYYFQGTPQSEKDKLQSGTFDNTGKYTGTAIVGTVGGQFFFGQDTSNGNTYMYICEVGSVWYRIKSSV